MHFYATLDRLMKSIIKLLIKRWIETVILRYLQIYLFLAFEEPYFSSIFAYWGII